MEKVNVLIIYVYETICIDIHLLYKIHPLLKKVKKSKNLGEIGENQ